MLENMQDISLQSSHEAGVVALCPELLGGFVSSIKSIYECTKKERSQRSVQAHRHCYPKGWSA